MQGSRTGKTCCGRTSFIFTEPYHALNSLSHPRILPSFTGSRRETRWTHYARRPVPPQLQRGRRSRPKVHLVQRREVPDQRHHGEQVHEAVREGRRLCHRGRSRRARGWRMGQREIFLQGTSICVVLSLKVKARLRELAHRPEVAKTRDHAT